MSRSVRVGECTIGGGTALSVQSMTNTPTADVTATIGQIRRIHEAGADIVRVAVPDVDAARALEAICSNSPVPVVADIHFDYRLALEAVSSGVAKLRINPGNIGAEDRVRAVAKACAAKGIPIRIGVNSGSLDKDLLARYGAPTAEAMCESALRQASMLERFDFGDIVVSLKSSCVNTTIEANRRFRERSDIPLHIGVTEAGTPPTGILKSAICVGALLCDGIGDTLRVSLTDDPETEPRAALEILRACGLYGAELISCPTCGRTRMNVIALAKELENRLRPIKKHIKVAVMGCEVNGPGEAREADFGIACGKDEGILFNKGRILGKYPEDKLLDALMEVVHEAVD